MEKLSEWEEIEYVNSKSLLFWLPNPPDCAVYKYISPHLLGEYVLIALVSNEKKSKLTAEHIWNDLFVDEMRTSMKIDMRGCKNKHFSSHGKYYGFGAVAKYKMKGNISFGAFADIKSKSL